MGKKGKKDRKAKKVPLVLPYTKGERDKKMANIMLELAMHDLTELLTPEIKAGVHTFIETGETYKKTQYFPEHSKELEIELINDKNKKTFLKLGHKRIITSDPTLQHLTSPSEV